MNQIRTVVCLGLVSIAVLQGQSISAFCPQCFVESKTVTAEGKKIGIDEYVPAAPPIVDVYRSETTIVSEDYLKSGTCTLPSQLQFSVQSHTRTTNIREQPIVSSVLCANPAWCYDGCQMPALTWPANNRGTYSMTSVDCLGITWTCSLTLLNDVWSGSPGANCNLDITDATRYATVNTSIQPTTRLTSQLYNQNALNQKITYSKTETATLSGKITRQDLVAGIKASMPAFSANWTAGISQAQLSLASTERCGNGTRMMYRFKVRGDAGKQISVQYLRLQYSSDGMLIGMEPRRAFATGQGPDQWAYTTGELEEVPEVPGWTTIQYQSVTYNEGRGGTLGGGGPGAGNVGSAAGALMGDISGSCRGCGSTADGGGGPSPSGVGFGVGASWSASLGVNRDGGSAGTLSVFARRPSAGLFTTAAISGNVDPEGSIYRESNGRIRQVLVAQTFVDFVTISANEYQVRFYDIVPGLRLNRGTTPWTFDTTSQPFRTWSFSNPDNTGGLGTRLRIRETISSSAPREFLYTYGTPDAGKLGWTLNGPGQAYDEVATAWIDSNGDRMERVARRNSGSNVDTEVITRRYRRFTWGEGLVEEDLGSLTPARRNYWEYFSNSSVYPVGSMLRKERRWDGSWKEYAYNGAGTQLQSVRSGFGSSPASQKSTDFEYTPIGVLGDSGAAVYSELPRSEIDKVNGATVGITWHAYSAGLHKEVRAWKSSALPTDPKNVVTIENFESSGPNAGQLKYVLHPNGTTTFYINAPSFTLAGVAVPGPKTRASSIGQPNVGRTGIQEGSVTTTVTGELGDLISRSTQYIKGGTVTALVDQMTVVASDVWKRPLDVQYLDGTHHRTVYACCGIDSETGRDGVVTQYNYDSARRLTGTTRLGITQRQTFNAADRSERLERIGTDGTIHILGKTSFDTAGMVTQKVNSLNGITKVSRDISSGRLIVTTTDQTDNGTRVEEFGYGGELLRLTGTAVFPTRYEYGTATITVPGSGETTLAETAKAVSLSPNGVDTGEWVVTYTDPLGHEILKQYADGATESKAYNNLNQLVWVSDADGVTSIFAYNSKGHLDTTVLDVNGNKQIDYSGPDRISKTSEDVQFVDVGAFGPGWYRVITSREYGADNAATELVTRQDYTSVDGLKSVSLALGTTTKSSTVLSGADRTTTVMLPDLSYTISKYRFGRLVEMSRYSNIGGLVARTIPGYDPHGRASTSSDLRNGTTTMTFNLADSIESVATSAPGDGGSPLVTWNFYDAKGQLRKIRHADGKESLYEYLPTGQLKKNYGGGVYPVEYTYDSQGRLKTMTTWQGFNQTSGTGTAGAAVTTWNYHAQRGWLEGKRYADGQGPNFGYTPGGRIRSREQQRLTGAGRLKSTYKYALAADNDPMRSGDLKSIEYNDGTTPRLMYEYNRRGLTKAVSQLAANGSLIRKGSYDWLDSGLLKRETSSAGELAGWYTDYAYNSQLRRQTMTVNNGGTAPLVQSYSYDAVGRLETTGDGSISATYSYESGADLVKQIYFRQGATGRLTTTRTYDKLNRLRNISSISTTSGQPQLGTSYEYNSANQRVKSTAAADGSYWVYEYDALGQVISGRRFWSDGGLVEGQQFEYAFDQIGNRTRTRSGGDSSGQNLRTTTYATANSLNQYPGPASRTNPRNLEVQGVARAIDGLTVNGQAATRQGEYFRRELTVPGTAAAQQNVDIQVAGGSSILGRKLFIPPQTETQVYDADGNLKQDGQWDYTWDAENRLIEVKTTLTAFNSGVPGRKVTYAYDWQGRLLERISYNGNPVSSLWAADSDGRTLYIYDGWNCVVELKAPSVWQRVQLWGLDVSGTPNGAGGVGGLLAIKSQVNGTHFMAYDGNGNVIGLYNAADGVCSGRYEYDPFGNLLRLTGAAIASENIWRFSTKRMDVVSGILHYEFRKYSSLMGNWLSRDPIEEVGGVNLSAIAGNNVVSRTDSLGLYEVDTHRYLTEYLARHAGFCEASSVAIGRATQALDDPNDPRDAMYGGRNVKNMKEYHFPSRWQLEELRLKAFDSCCKCETQDWVAIGEYLHALEDTFSHTDGRGDRNWTYYKQYSVSVPIPRIPTVWPPGGIIGGGSVDIYYGIGHGRSGHRPDWTWEDAPKLIEMAKLVFEELKELMQSCGRGCKASSWTTIEPTIQKFALHKPTSFYKERFSIFWFDNVTFEGYDEKIKLLDDSFNLDPMYKKVRKCRVK